MLPEGPEHEWQRHSQSVTDPDVVVVALSYQCGFVDASDWLELGDEQIAIELLDIAPRRFNTKPVFEVALVQWNQRHSEFEIAK